MIIILIKKKKLHLNDDLDMIICRSGSSTDEPILFDPQYEIWF